MITLVDIDNILNNFTETCLYLYNHDKGTSFNVSNILQYDITESLHITNKEEFRQNYLCNSTVVDYCRPLPEAPKYLEKITKLSQVYLVTARDWTQLTNIQAWVSKFYPFIKDNQIIRCQDKSMVRGDILIDDCLDNLVSFPGGKIVLDYPWNRYSVEDYDMDIPLVPDLTNFIFRTTDWKHIYQTIKTMISK